ncbi:hypothetical protein BU17DRAFT_39027 [Hysterangium stoloniferum]|nr:hypothetical protein BU17DRAFT_39027 [Hysterangium stoloniferum]
MAFDHPVSDGASPVVPEPTGFSNLLRVSRVILLQARDLLNTICSDEQFTYESKLIPGSTIGKHMRHARDHFELLFQAMKMPGPYIFSYDTRSRNTPMETSRQAAYDAMSSTISFIDQLLIPHLDEPVTLNAVTPYMQALQSSFGRELWFCGLHAVHHWSMVRVIAGELNLQVDESFGVAPSTILYRESSISLSKSKI